jgi:wyosine [tRNA(Phe)-imidazoG37] synthetase (radical SAM superfamily)
MINEMRGVPGVQSERLTEAFTVKHCALSLVGEPIMYPRINEMLSALHAREISSFMVTNAQFPEHIKSLDPVTQLYVSVDASTRDSLKAIDRPLFKGTKLLILVFLFFFILFFISMFWNGSSWSSMVVYPYYLCVSHCITPHFVFYHCLFFHIDFWERFLLSLEELKNKQQRTVYRMTLVCNILVMMK